jgi:hypothetical protein
MVVMGAMRAMGAAMKGTLDRALAEIAAPMDGLRAVLLSAAPDGMIAWSWSCDDKHEAALGFAALDRAATLSLETLGASQRGRSLLLCAEDTWVAAWPLHDLGPHERRGERLVITVVFAGSLQTGLVMVLGSRIRMQIRMALDKVRDAEQDGYRKTLVDLVLVREEAAAALSEIAVTAGVDLRRIGRPELLNHDERGRILQIARASPVHE